MSSSQIVLDLETQKTFDEVGGGRNTAELKISVVGVYFYKTDEFKTFEEQQIPELEQALSTAERIIGFNTHRFDFVVLQPYLKRLRLSQLPSLDLMAEIEQTLGHRVSLQNLAQPTLNEGKSGSGLDAIDFFRKGEMEKLKKYCLDDVRLTRDLYEFGKREGYLAYLSKDKASRLTVKVGWKDPSPEPNLSLF